MAAKLTLGGWPISDAQQATLLSRIICSATLLPRWDFDTITPITKPHRKVNLWRFHAYYIDEEMAWHPSTCAQLDLTWNDDRPGCRRCDQWGPQPTITQPQPPPAPPPDTKRFELYCTWPPCIKFVGHQQMSFQHGALRLLEDQATLSLLPHVLDTLKSLATGAEGSDCPSHTGTPVRAESPPSLPASTIYGPLPTSSSIRLLCLHGSSSVAAQEQLHCIALSKYTVFPTQPAPSSKHFRTLGRTPAVTTVSVARFTSALAMRSYRSHTIVGPLSASSGPRLTAYSG